MATSRQTTEGPGEELPARTGDRLDPQNRLSSLFDSHTLRLRTSIDASGVVTAEGRIDGITTLAFCTDARISGGAMGVQGCDRIAALIDSAVTLRTPVIGVWHSGGARLAEGVSSLEAVGRVFVSTVRASGRIPQISVIVGAAAGGAAYGPALTDVVIMSDDARLFVTGPEIIRRVTGENVDMRALGGPEIHATRSGVAHITVGDEDAAFATARRVTRLLCAQHRPDPDRVAERSALNAILPAHSNRAYDVRPLIQCLLDEGSGLELHPSWAPNLVTYLGYLGAGAVGVLANNPLRMGGCLNSEASDKGARFVRMCDALDIPMIVIVDAPGYLPGVRQEHDGVLRRGAKLLHAFASATTPRVSLVTRKAYGGAYLAMNARAMGATAVFAWPKAEVAVMGAGPAIDILHRRDLASTTGVELDRLRERLIRDHQRRLGGLDRLISEGIVDAVINPSSTPMVLARTLFEAAPGARNHSNIPL
jgi:acetyl-CoA/propionyl-CoA carboxylase carboxyl transferase subunit